MTILKLQDPQAHYNNALNSAGGAASPEVNRVIGFFRSFPIISAVAPVISVQRQPRRILPVRRTRHVTVLW